jgi:hypothetical protein
MTDFISEDDLDTIERFLRYHGLNAETAPPEELAFFSPTLRSAYDFSKNGAAEFFAADARRASVCRGGARRQRAVQ